jgi:hypothetical protein
MEGVHATQHHPGRSTCRGVCSSTLWRKPELAACVDVCNCLWSLLLEAHAT